MPPGSTFNVWVNTSDKCDFCVSFPGLADFWVSFAAKEIHISIADPDLDPSSLLHLLSDQVVPRIIAHGGPLILHAGAAEIGSGAVLFLGESGRGKSTLAASFVSHGHRLLGDDAMIISERDDAAYCQSTYPSLRLHSDSLAGALVGVQAAMVKHVGNRKLSVELEAGRRSAQHPLPILACIFLGPPCDISRPKLCRLSPGQVCMGLIEHSFWLVPNDRVQAGAKLAAAASIAGKVAGFQLDYKRDFGQTSLLVEAILGSLAGFEAGKANLFAVGTGSETR